MLDKLKWFFRGSVTVLWARVLTVLGILGALLIDPNVNGIVTDLARDLLDDPRWASIAVAVIGVVTELARARSLGRR